MTFNDNEWNHESIKFVLFLFFCFIFRFEWISNHCVKQCNLLSGCILIGESVAHCILTDTVQEIVEVKEMKTTKRVHITKQCSFHNKNNNSSKIVWVLSLNGCYCQISFIFFMLFFLVLNSYWSAFSLPCCAKMIQCVIECKPFKM